MTPRLFRAREPLSEPERGGTQGPSRAKGSWRASVIVGAAVIAGATALGLIFAPGGNAPGGADSRTGAAVSADPTPTNPAPTNPAPPTTPAPVATSDPSAPEGTVSPEIATTAVESLLVTLASDPEGVQPDDTTLTSLATGAILNEIAADTQELEANGWTRTGVAKVDGVRIISNDPSANPATAVVEVCVDSTDVRLLDVAGDVIGDPLATPRSLNIYSLVSEGGVWRVAARTFPDEPAC